MSSQTDILIFDSGVGGLSIFAEVQQLLPQARLLFASDNAAYPYGNKSDDILLARVKHIIGYLIEQLHPKVIVIACNSASTVCLPLLRQTFTTPIVGVVPAIKPAAKTTKTKVLGLLATPATIKRKYTQDLIDQFAPSCQVVHIGSSELVDMAEKKLSGLPLNEKALRNILQPFFDNDKIDTVVLGCTHFPLLHHEISLALGKSIVLVDSGLAIATQVKKILGQNAITLNEKHCLSNSAIFTKEIPHNQHWAHKLHQFNISNIEVRKI